MKGRPLHEECGVFGVFGADKAAANVLVGLSALHHRGQEGCGVAMLEDSGRIAVRKGLGLVSQNFPIGSFRDHPGRSAIGHVRYGTSGGGELDNVQPFVFHRDTHDFAVVHNGNIVNTEELKIQLERMGTLFRSSSDSEILGHLVHSLSVGNEGLNSHSLKRALNLIDGAFSFLVLTPDRLYACRDRYGFRPLCIGKRPDGAIVFASESCALDAVGAAFLRDVEPGEVVMVDGNGLHSDRSHCGGSRRSLCVFEYIYFARPDSVLDGKSVCLARQRAGEFLAQEHPVEADVVVGVPDSGLDAAIGFARASGIPYAIGLTKNKYVGRTFIAPTQSEREMGVNLKLNPIRSVIEDKRVVLIDDSIVRGTTCRRTVEMLRRAGAKEIHMRISAPPFIAPCFYGTDIDSAKGLIANHHTVPEIAKLIGADSLGYLSLEHARLLTGEDSGFCTACFSGDYPTEIPAPGSKSCFERHIHEP